MAGRRTDLAVEELLFHLAHEVDLVEYLQSVRRGDLSSHVLACVAQFVCRHSVAVFEFAEDMDQEFETI